jgi:hypothetical protein
MTADRIAFLKCLISASAVENGRESLPPTGAFSQQCILFDTVLKRVIISLYQFYRAVGGGL